MLPESSIHDRIYLCYYYCYCFYCYYFLLILHLSTKGWILPHLARSAPYVWRSAPASCSPCRIQPVRSSLLLRLFVITTCFCFYCHNSWRFFFADNHGFHVRSLSRSSFIERVTITTAHTMLTVLYTDRLTYTDNGLMGRL